MSSEDTEQFRQFIGRLQKEDQRPAALNDIKNLLVFKPAREATTTIRDVGISKIVECLNVPNTYAILFWSSCFVIPAFWAN